MELRMIQANKTKKLAEFEILRAVSIILLMFSHSDIYSQTVYGIKLEPIGPYLHGFFLGSFFFMSGYFLEISNKKKDRGFLASIWSKIIRLFPPYWVALLLFRFVLQISLKRTDFVAYFLDLQFLFSPVYIKEVITLWYISVLFSYFVIFGLFLSRSTKTLLVWSVFVFAVSYVLNYKYRLFDYRFFEYFSIFLIGILLARFDNIYEALIKISIPVQVLLVLAGSVLYGIFYFGHYEVTSWPYLLSSDFHMITTIMLALRIFRTGYLDHKIWSSISYASFYAYLFHRPIWDIMFRLIKFPFHVYIGWYRLIPGAIIIFIICYYLQFGYDKTVQAAEVLWKRTFSESKI
jgi:peptidoglycan/LPS O-acetylase OafA/YrhL